METGTVKRIVLDEGADMCGVAPAGRFDEAPPGFHPRDIYGDCSSVLVFLKRFPAGPMLASNSVPYTYMCDLLKSELDNIGYNASVTLEDLGITAVGVPADDPAEHWEEERRYGRGILSLRHAGHLAGLGVLGRNTLLKNDEFGNLFQIGALLLNVEMDPDPVDTREPCPPDCRLCLDSCPRNALDGTTVDQALCRPLSNFTNRRGFKLYHCWKCRQACPDARGNALNRAKALS